MALYDRDYIKNGSSSATYNNGEAYTQSAEGLRSFIKQTYQLFAASLLAASVGAYIGLSMAPLITGATFWILVILEFAFLFGLYAVKEKPGINLLVMFGFTFLSGITLTPLLHNILGMPGGASIVGNAFLLTSVAFGGISMFAMTTTRDFSNMGKMLFITLIIVIIASLINIFVGSPMMQLVISSISAILFSAFILYDTQNIIKGAYSTPIEASIALYLDFLNLFVSLLQILGIMNSSDD